MASLSLPPWRGAGTFLRKIPFHSREHRQNSKTAVGEANGRPGLRVWLSGKAQAHTGSGFKPQYHKNKTKKPQSRKHCSDHRPALIHGWTLVISLLIPEGVTKGKWAVVTPVSVFTHTCAGPAEADMVGANRCRLLLACTPSLTPQQANMDTTSWSL